VAICGVDKDYPKTVPLLTRQIKSTKPEMTVILSGYPEDQIATYQQAGLDGYIQQGTDVVETLATLQNGLQKENDDSNA
jgi:methylmalonyl-CoA mutase